MASTVKIIGAAALVFGLLRVSGSIHTSMYVNNSQLLLGVVIILVGFLLLREA